MITIENINGQLMTVVWHRKVEPTWKTEWYKLQDCYALLHVKNTTYHIATALPPLPRNPTPDDAQLLYRYLSEGIQLMGKPLVSPEDFFNDDSDISYSHWPLVEILKAPTQITHATYNGQRVEIAITGGDDAKEG